jgi:hypothetical protein
MTSYESAVRHILEAALSDLDKKSHFYNQLHQRLFELQYPALSGAIAQAQHLINNDKELDL